MTTHKPRRSALFLPAVPKMIAKARDLPADVIIFDLEDAVAPEAKLDARAAAVAACQEGGFGRRELVIRVNGLDTPWGAEDLAAAALSGADAVLAPKVSTPADIAAYDAALSAAPAHVQLWTMIETAASVLRLDALGAMAATTRLSLWVMGANDLAREMRSVLAPGRLPFLPFLSQGVAAARAHGLAILDGVCNDFRDLTAFREEAEQGRLFGFNGKSLIHPDQIAPCNAVFSPSAADLAWARAVIAGFAASENAGKGAIRVEGKMAELLHLKQAQRLIAMAALL